MHLLRILRLGLLLSCGWLALAAVLWQVYGFPWALLAIAIWVWLLRLFRLAILGHAQSLAAKKDPS